jgi:undecaprenyl-phosphate 4-deoxy-4-formamido-L-arabinose transferase
METDNNIKISFVVPVYNGARILKPLIERLSPVGSSYGRYEIILVNDGSRDHSQEILDGLHESYPQVCIIKLSRNFGQHNATLAGLAHARGEIIVTLDQDLQHPPEEIGKLVDRLREGFDVVYGLPIRRPHGFFRNISSEFSKWLSSKVLSTNLGGNFSSFRAMRAWVVGEIIQYDSAYIFIDGFISWTTANVGGVLVQNPNSDLGSQYTFVKLINHGINLLVNFSIRPLQAASVVGLFSAIIGLIAASYLLIIKMIYGVAVQGWTSLMVMVMVIGGAQIAFLGLIGEYIGRILMNTNRAPKYVIRSIRRNKAGSDPDQR